MSEANPRMDEDLQSNDEPVRRWTLLLLPLCATIALLLVAIVGWRARHLTTGKPITVYAAAGLRQPLESAATDFTSESGRPIEFIWGGTGTLYGQLKLTGRGDLFIAADAYTPDLAVREDLLQHPTPIALQRLVIITAPGNPKGVATLADLSRDDIRLALADPEQAAVGRATVSAYALVQLPMPQAQDAKATVGDVALAVQTGAADAGLVWHHVAASWPGVEEVAKLEFTEPIVMAVVARDDADAAFGDWLRVNGERYFSAAGLESP